MWHPRSSLCLPLPCRPPVLARIWGGMGSTALSFTPFNPPWFSLDSEACFLHSHSCTAGGVSFLNHPPLSTTYFGSPWPTPNTDTPPRPSSLWGSLMHVFVWVIAQPHETARCPVQTPGTHLPLFPLARKLPPSSTPGRHFSSQDPLARDLFCENSLVPNHRMSYSLWPSLMSCCEW